MYYVEMNVMLEMFFDNEKVFSVFEKILKSPSEEVLVPKILYESGISPADGAEILQSFVFLGILEETEKTFETGIFKFNSNSFVVLAICFFDFSKEESSVMSVVVLVIIGVWVRISKVTMSVVIWVKSD